MRRSTGPLVELTNRQGRNRAIVAQVFVGAVPGILLDPPLNTSTKVGVEPSRHPIVDSRDANGRDASGWSTFVIDRQPRCNFN